MYRATESTTPTYAEVFCQMADTKNEEEKRKTTEKSSEDIVKILNHCLRKICSAAKKGEYSIYNYKYSRPILDRLLFWQPAIWNKTTLDLLKSKLIEMNFNCNEASEGTLFITWRTF